MNPAKSNSVRCYPKEYVPSPGSEVMAMLSAFAGGSVCAAGTESAFGFPGTVLAGTGAGGRPLLFVSNPLEIPVLVRLRWPGFPAECALRRIDADSFAAAAPGEYRRRNADITLSGGRFILPARSVTLLAGK